MISALQIIGYIGKARDLSAETVTSWMERINELNESYSLEDIWSMNKSGHFFKGLFTTG